jgi:hypothetical protein
MTPPAARRTRNPRRADRLGLGDRPDGSPQMGLP